MRSEESAMVKIEEHTDSVNQNLDSNPLKLSMIIENKEETAKERDNVTNVSVKSPANKVSIGPE